jgi:tight adherence protein B
LTEGMAIAVSTFIGVIVLVLGIFWIAIARPEAAAQRSLRKRMRPEDPGRKKRLTIPQSELRGRRRTPFKGLQSVVDQSGLKMTVPGLIFLCMMTASVGALIVGGLSGQVGIAAVTGALAGFAPYWVVRHAATRRMWKFEEQFPEAIDLIARALRAGHAFPMGLSMVADEVGPPVGPEFKLLYDRQYYGMPLNDALRAFAHRVPILDARFFVTAVLTQREAGGNLSGVLDNLASVIRERFKVKRQVKVISAHGRMTAGILSALPPFVGAAQMVLAPDQIRLLVTDDLGIKMLIFAVVMQVIGMLIIRKVVKVEY